MKLENFKLNLETSLLVLVIVLAFLFRLYKVTNPPLDWHAFRQADTASVTREYVKHGIDLLHPKYHDLGNIQSGQYNPEGYRMVEFPVINALIAQFVRLTKLDLVVVSRLFSIFASLGTLTLLYFLVKDISGKRAGLWTAVWFGFLPYAIFYSRAILPEPFMLFFLTLGLTSFYYFLKTPSRWYFWLVSLVGLSLALLLKPFAIFIFPVLLTFAYGYKKTHLLRWSVMAGYLSLGLTLVPLTIWRQWIKQFPAGIPASDWLFNSDGIRLRPAWFRWLGYERLVKLFLGFIGVIFLPFALVKLTKKEALIYGVWWLGIITYFIVFATGNVKHDYYQNLALPILVITLGRGSTIIERLLTKKLNPLIGSLVVLGLVLVTNLSAWPFVKGYFMINHPEYIVAGEAVDKLLPKDAVVIAPDFGDTQFLFMTNRRGFPIGFEIDKKIQHGAQYYVSTSFDDEVKDLEKKYFTIKKTPEYIILDLTKTKTQKIKTQP